MGFSIQEHWSGLPCPSPGHLPTPRIKLASLSSPELAGRFFTTSATWKAIYGIGLAKKSSFELFPCYQNLNELFWPTQYLSSCLPLERFDFPAESSWPECVTAEKNILETNNWFKITLKSHGKSLSLGWVNAILSLYTFHGSVNVFPPLVHHPWARTVLCIQ